MTVPQPPTAGETELSAKLDASLQGGTGPDIEAPLDSSIAGEAASAEAAGKAWCAAAGDLMDSAQGFGSSGHSIGYSGEDWPVDMSFPHQGP